VSPVLCAVTHEIPWMTGKHPRLNSVYGMYDKWCKKILKLKHDASNKQTDYDSDSDETEEFAKITAMQSLNESLQ
jgi:hypothetical protein